MAGERGRLHADAAFHAFLAQVGAPRPRRDGHVDGVAARRHAELFRADPHQWADVAGFELVGLDHREVGQAAEVRLEAPDPLVGGQHRVVVGRRVLVVDVVAVDRDPVARLPVPYGGARPQHDARGVAADDVVRQVVALAPHALPAEAVEVEEGRQRLEDRRPDGVEVDGAGHHRHHRLVGRQLGDRHLVDVDALLGILLLGEQPGEQLDVVLVDGRGAERLGQREFLQLGSGGVVQDGVQDLLHA